MSAIAFGGGGGGGGLATLTAACATPHFGWLKFF